MKTLIKSIAFGMITALVAAVSVPLAGLVAGLMLALRHVHNKGI